MPAQQLRAGQVFRLFTRYINPPKWKFLVLAYVLDDGRARLFPVNSEPTQFQKQNPELEKHQIPIGPAAYPAFLKHASVLSCSELLGGWSASELEDVLINNPDCSVGELRAEEIAKIRHIVEASRVLSGRDKEMILAQLK